MAIPSPHGIAPLELYLTGKAQSEEWMKGKEPPRPPSPFSSERFADIDLPDDEDWLIHELLPTSGLAVIYGPSGAGKSFVALDLAMHIAGGLDYAGRKTVQGGVVYICAEGARNFRKRIVGAKQHLNLENPHASLISAAPNLGTRSDDVSKLIAAIQTQSTDLGWKPSVVILDTLQRVTAGMDENSAEGMGIFISNTGALANAIGCLIIAVHHSGKQVDAGMRGSSALHGSSDTVWSVAGTHGSGTVEVVKSKDGEDGMKWSFDLRTTEVGTKTDGSAVTTCVVEMSSAPTPAKPSVVAKAKPLSDAIQLLMDCFQAALARRANDASHQGDMRAVKVEVVRDAFIQTYTVRHKVKHESGERTFRRALKAALKDNLLFIDRHPGGADLWTP